MKDLIIDSTISYNINNTNQNNSPTGHNSSISYNKAKDVSSFSSYLQRLCEVVKFEEKINSPSSSSNCEVSPTEIKESLLSAFNFLRQNSEPEVMSKPAHRHVMVGNCLTVYSNLEFAPMQKPFKKTSSEDLPVYVKSIINTDPSLSHLLKYGCISISPVSPTTKLPEKPNLSPRGDFSGIDFVKKGCAEKLLRLKKEACNFALKNVDITDDTKVDVKKIFPEVFYATTVNIKTEPQSLLMACSSYSRGISNDTDFSFNMNEESQYNGNINPSDVLEVCIQEDDAKSASSAAKTLGSKCHICRKYFASPIEMYFHVLSHSKASDSNEDEFRFSGYNVKLEGLPDIEITATRKVNYEGRNKKLKSILKDINYNQNEQTNELEEMEVQPKELNFHSAPEFALINNKRHKRASNLRNRILLKNCYAQSSNEIRNKLVSKSSYRIKLTRNIKGRVNRAVHLLSRRNSLNK